MFVNVLKRETGERRFILFSVLLLINGLFFLHVQAAGEQTEKFVPKLSIRQEFNAPENVNVPVDSTFQYQLEGGSDRDGAFAGWGAGQLCFFFTRKR